MAIRSSQRDYLTKVGDFHKNLSSGTYVMAIFPDSAIAHAGTTLQSAMVDNGFIKHNILLDQAGTAPEIQ
jgi:hypothetical protein